MRIRRTRGVRRRTIASFGTAEIVWSQLELTAEQTATILEWAEASIGTPYSRLDFIAAAIGSLLREHTPAWFARITARGTRLICSQLASEALASADIHLADPAYPGALTPGDLGRAFLERGWTDRG